jgi:hypothetical protein
MARRYIVVGRSGSVENFILEFFEIFRILVSIKASI